MASALLRPALAQFRPWLPGPPWLASSEVSSGPSGGEGSGSKLCPMGTLQPGPGPPPLPEGPSPSTPYAAPLPEVLSGSPTLKELLSPARLTPPLPATFSSPSSLCACPLLAYLHGPAFLFPPEPLKPLLSGASRRRAGRG